MTLTRVAKKINGNVETIKVNAQLDKKSWDGKKNYENTFL